MKVKLGVLFHLFYGLNGVTITINEIVDKIASVVHLGHLMEKFGVAVTF